MHDILRFHTCCGIYSLSISLSYTNSPAFSPFLSIFLSLLLSLSFALSLSLALSLTRSLSLSLSLSLALSLSCSLSVPRCRSLVSLFYLPLSLAHSLFEYVFVCLCKFSVLWDSNSLEAP